MSYKSIDKFIFEVISYYFKLKMNNIYKFSKYNNNKKNLY
jgi:hypothetical protein